MKTYIFFVVLAIACCTTFPKEEEEKEVILTDTGIDVIDDAIDCVKSFGVAGSCISAVRSAIKNKSKEKAEAAVKKCGSAGQTIWKECKSTIIRAVTYLLTH